MQTLLETVVSNALVASVLALVAFAVSRWRRPALAHALWLLVLIKLLTPPLVPVSLPALDTERRPGFAPETISREETGRVPFNDVPFHELSSDDIAALLAWAEQDAADTRGNSALADPASEAAPEAGSWQQWFVPLWLSGSGVWLACSLVSIGRFQRLLRLARRASSAVQNQTRELASRLGLPRAPEVWLVPGAVSPMIWAIGAAPRLLFPARLLDRLDGEQRAALLLHELAHVRRRDHWVRLAELLVVTLYWWHPVVWWARRELREAEEQCCDAWVVWASRGEGHAYARALLETVAFVSHSRCPLPATASGIGYVSQLRRRLTMIMQGNTPRSLSALGWIVVLTLGLCLLPLAAQAEQPKKSGGDDKDQEIKALKQQLRSLEQSKRQEARQQAEAARQAERAARQALKNARGSADDKESTEVKQAMETAAELKRLIGEKRKELEVLQAKLNATLEQLDAHKKGGKVKVKELKERKDLKDMKDFGQFKAIDAKKLAEEIQESIRNNPDLKKLQDLKKLGELKGLDMDLKKLDELKKLGNIKLDFKELDVLKKQLGDIKGLDAKQLDDIKKTMKKEFDRAIQKDFDKVSKDKGRKAEDIDARLDRLMKEINELRREIHEGKGRQVK